MVFPTDAAAHSKALSVPAAGRRVITLLPARFVLLPSWSVIFCVLGCALLKIPQTHPRISRPYGYEHEYKNAPCFSVEMVL